MNFKESAMSPSCKNCLHFKAEDGIEMVHDWGTCLRYPPVMLADSEGSPFSSFPLVNDNERCGEWKAGQ